MLVISNINTLSYDLLAVKVVRLPSIDQSGNEPGAPGSNHRSRGPDNRQDTALFQIRGMICSLTGKKEIREETGGYSAMSMKDPDQKNSKEVYIRQAVCLTRAGRLSIKKTDNCKAA